MSSGPTASRGRVLIVDDEPQNRKVLERLLQPEGYETRTAEHGEAALSAIAERAPDVVLLDVNMPGPDGIEVCRRIKSTHATRFVPVVLVTGLSDKAHRMKGIEAGADDFLGKPFDFEELRARVASLVRLKRLTDDLDSAESVILSLALTVEARDSCTEGHCQRLAGYSVALGQALGLDTENLAALQRGGYLHDVGKIGIPDAVLLKPGPLTPGEYDLMKRHTVIGDRLCGHLRSLQLVRPIVRSHHEHLNGSGYPDGLRGDAVPLLAQIVSIADLYDAVTTVRPYRPARAPEVAYQELRDEVARGLKNAALVEAFIALGEEGTLPVPSEPSTVGR